MRRTSGRGLVSGGATAARGRQSQRRPATMTVAKAAAARRAIHRARPRAGTRPVNDVKLSRRLPSVVAKGAQRLRLLGRRRAARLRAVKDERVQRAVEPDRPWIGIPVAPLSRVVLEQEELL